jgi:hypothetical protein
MKGSNTAELAMHESALSGTESLSLLLAVGKIN